MSSLTRKMKSMQFHFSNRRKKVFDSSTSGIETKDSHIYDDSSTADEQKKWGWSSGAPSQRYMESESYSGSAEVALTSRQLNLALSEGGDDESFEYESLTNFCPVPRTVLPTDVVIAIQASTISSLGIKIRENSKNVLLDGSSGHAIVGVVKEVGHIVPQHGIKVGDRVATIVKSIIGNLRYAKVSVDLVVRVPCGVCSDEAACAAYTYLVAFQSLHHGRSIFQRYSNKSFVGKRILVIGGDNSCGHALIELSSVLNAGEVFATSQYSNHGLIESLGATPLSDEPKEWLPVVKGNMDIVVVSVLHSNFSYEHAKLALKEKGKIVCIGSSTTLEGVKQGKAKWTSLYEQYRAQVSLILSQNVDATYYDLFCNLDNYRVQLKTDLEHVFEMLDNQQIKPKITKYVTSDDVSYGLATIDPINLTAGSIVCEPWRRRGPPKSEKTNLSKLYE